MNEGCSEHSGKRVLGEGFLDTLWMITMVASVPVLQTIGDIEDTKRFGSSRPMPNGTRACKTRQGVEGTDGLALNCGNIVKRRRRCNALSPAEALGPTSAPWSPIADTGELRQAIRASLLDQALSAGTLPSHLCAQAWWEPVDYPQVLASSFHVSFLGDGWWGWGKNS